MTCTRPILIGASLALLLGCGPSYVWSKPGLSDQYGQQLSRADEEHCRRRNTTWVPPWGPVLDQNAYDRCMLDRGWVWTPKTKAPRPAPPARPHVPEE